MDPVLRVREYLLDNVGHITCPGRASFDPATQRWFVPIHFRTRSSDIVIGDVELDRDGHIMFAPTREELAARVDAVALTVSKPGPDQPAGPGS
jgi:hypothetical protein